jgi:uncharacterized protein YkwD
MGENLAMAPSVRQAQDLLMASPPHRENILKPEYDRVGIGVVVAPNGERWFTEDFAGGAPLS